MKDSNSHDAIHIIESLKNYSSIKRRFMDYGDYWSFVEVFELDGMKSKLQNQNEYIYESLD